MKRAIVLALAGAALGRAPAAHAWETSTHVGLAEQAALAADADAWLRQLGFRGGLFEPLIIPPADAPDLFAALANHSPIDGYVPDLRGQQPALGWLMAGAAIADATPGWAANHFFDPASGAGWRRPATTWLGRLRGVSTPARGVAAPDWVVSSANPLGLDGFLDQYAKAITGATPGERSRAMGGALVAAGAILHVLADLGSPSHVRDDRAAHTDRIGHDAADVGSRFERLAAVAWGRLGVPAPRLVPSRPTLRGFFTGAGRDAASPGTDAGLADWTAAHFFSEHTLPRAVEIGRVSSKALPAVLDRSLVRPRPAVPHKLSLIVASQPQGTTLRDRAGVCLARYRNERSRLSWWLDDDCELEQAAAILPVVGGYQTALLRWLSRGQLAVAVDGGTATVRARGVGLGAGQLTVLTEDGRGVRATAGTAAVTGAADGAVAGTVAFTGGRFAVAMFRGVDDAGQPLIAVGRVELP